MPLYTVVIYRDEPEDSLDGQLEDDDYVRVIQLRNELQEAWNTGSVAGAFQIIEHTSAPTDLSAFNRCVEEAKERFQPSVRYEVIARHLFNTREEAVSTGESMAGDGWYYDLIPVPERPADD